MIVGLLALHGALAVGILLASTQLGRGAFLVGGLAPLATSVWAAVHATDVLDGTVLDHRSAWVDGLGLALDFRFDAFALLMLLLVSGLGTLVFAYGWRYFGHNARAARAAGYLTLFAGAMLGLVLADNLLVLYVCWELTSITSYLLIGLDDRQDEARDSALHALLVTGLGGLVMLAGLVLLGQQAGTFRLSEILADPPSGHVTAAAVVLVLVGAFTKSAQYPFHSWLPAAMVAPTPISAYLHSAAMVKAGVYIVARLAPAFGSVGVWRPLVVIVGLTTMIAGGLRALRPFDLKQILAFGTVSQLGFMIVLFGIGRPEATAAGCAVILAHGLFKAALFMVVGIVDHQAGTRDIRQLNLGPGWTPTKTVAVISAASMGAVPPLAGFVAKESAYDALLHGSVAERWVLAGLVAGSVLTVAYSARLLAGLLRPSSVARPLALTAPTSGRTAPPPAAAFLAPAALLAAVSIILGIVPSAGNGVIDAATNALDAESHAHLALWHGLTPALWLSIATLSAGGLLFGFRDAASALQARTAPRVSGADVYVGATRLLNRLARRVTGIAQPGSLPIYAAVILFTATIPPLFALVVGDRWQGLPETVGSAAYVPIAALLVVGAIGATAARRRFAAALLLGAVGYGMALVFVVQGAPDLALTQFAIETLSVVLFLLVLRRLPDRFERRTPAIARTFRLTVASAVGVFVLVMAIAAGGARTAAPVSTEMVARAEPDGGGSNVVNVILVDFRGLDTLGEITVLVVAAIGAAALARAGRQPRRRPAPGQSSSEPTAGLHPEPPAGVAAEVG